MNKITFTFFLIPSLCCAMDAITIHKHVPSLWSFAAKNLPSSHDEFYSKIQPHFDETPNITLSIENVVKQGTEFKSSVERQESHLSSNAFWLTILNCKDRNLTFLRHWFVFYMNDEARRSFLHHLDIKERGDWLDEAVLHCSVNHVEEILQSVPVTPEKKHEALLKALVNNKIDTINLLINHGAIFNLDEGSFSNVVRSNHVDMVELVLSHQKIPKDWLDREISDIYTYETYYSNSFLMVQMLIKHGATMGQWEVERHQKKLIAKGYYAMAFVLEQLIPSSNQAR